MSWLQEMLMKSIVEVKDCPPDTLIILNPRYHFVPSESDPMILEERLDIEATAKASAVIRNIGK